jgi:hypothetical protein
MRPWRRPILVSIVIFVALLLSAWAAATALAAREWKIGPEGSSNSLEELGLANETVSVSLATGTELSLEGKVLGVELLLRAGTVEGIETKIIKGGTDSGKLKLSMLSVTKPAKCSAPAITTAALKTELVEVGGVLYDKFSAASGEILATITLTGAECALAETSINLKGTVFGEVEPLGVQLVGWPLRFSKAINTAAGGSLKLGVEPASMTANLQFKLSGGKAGDAMGAGPAIPTTRLCKKLETPCKAAETYPANTELEGKGKSVVQLTIAAVPPVPVTITCTEAGFTAKSAEEVGKPRLGVTLNGVSFAKCAAEPGGGACGMSGNGGLAGSIEYTNNGSGLWDFPAKFRFKCALPAPQNEVVCELVEGTPALAVTGGAPANVTGSKKLLTRIVGGVNCPSVVEWTPSYSVNKPNPLFVAE